MTVRVALVGAVQSTERALRTLARCGAAPVLLITLSQQKSSRHSDYVDLEPLATELGVPVVHADDVNEAGLLERLKKLDLDVAMVIGWSRLCGAEFIATPRLGTLGYHPALLPAMRGRAALGWTILLNPPETGGTLFWIDEGVDSGPIAAQARFSLTGTETLGQLMDMQIDALETMLASIVKQLSRGERPAREQDQSQASYLALRRPEDGQIDWTQPAADIERLVRAVSRPYPGAFTHYRGKKLIIWSARLATFPEWYAQTGQVFTFENEAPVVRCGDGLDLVLIDFDVEPSGDEPEERPSLKGQPRLGRPA